MTFIWPRLLITMRKIARVLIAHLNNSTTCRKAGSAVVHMPKPKVGRSSGVRTSRWAFTIANSRSYGSPSANVSVSIVTRDSIVDLHRCVWAAQWDKM
jgi:hypothetical protein